VGSAGDLEEMMTADAASRPTAPTMSARRVDTRRRIVSILSAPTGSAAPPQTAQTSVGSRLAAGRFSMVPLRGG